MSSASGGGSPYDTGLLSCPACGAGCAPSGRVCAHCGNHLAARRCSGCSALHFAGALICTRCGRTLRGDGALGPAIGASCPRCGYALAASTVGEAEVEECGRCGGIFVPAQTLRRLVADREQARAVPLARASPPVMAPDPVRYLRCPSCPQLMNRVSFGRRSGVVVDVCRDHGTWFDAGELVAALEFVAQGGLVAAPERDRGEAVAPLPRGQLVDLASWEAQRTGVLPVLGWLWRALRAD